jgi:hypothetical protein
LDQQDDRLLPRLSDNYPLDMKKDQIPDGQGLEVTLARQQKEVFVVRVRKETRSRPGQLARMGPTADGLFGRQRYAKEYLGPKSLSTRGKTGTVRDRHMKEECRKAAEALPVGTVDCLQV